PRSSCMARANGPAARSAMSISSAVPAGRQTKSATSRICVAAPSRRRPGWRTPEGAQGGGGLVGRARGGLIMGSDSDWPVMEAAAHALAEFDIPFEVGVVSAHRTPDRMLDYARSAASRGLAVIIAGAGGAAHLPGMIASATPLPVVGVP